MPHRSDLNYHEGVTLSESIHMYYTLFTCFTILRLLGNSFLQSQRARASSLTIGLVTRIQLSQPQPDLILWLGTETPLQAEALENGKVFMLLGTGGMRYRSGSF